MKVNGLDSHRQPHAATLANMWLLSNLLVLAALCISAVSAVEVTYRNKHYYYFDVDGSAIDSTNGKVEWVKDQYFWIGEPDCTIKVQADTRCMLLTRAFVQLAVLRSVIKFLTAQRI